MFLFMFAFMFTAGSASLAAYPDRPVRMLVGFTPGGGTDQLARLLALGLTEKWGKTVTVENRPGADGDIALELMIAAPADGYTLVMATNALTITPNLRKLSYDPVSSFAPVILIGSVPGVLAVRATLPVSTLGELIALARSKPGQLNYASSGTGTTPYLQMALLAKMTNINVVHIPYKGNVGPPLLSGEVDMGFSGVAGLLELTKAGRIKALAVSTKSRAAQMPDVPTVAEAANLPDYEASTWYGLLAKAGTPKDLIDQINTDINAVMRIPATAKRIDGLGYITVAGSPENFSAIIKADLNRWSTLFKSMTLTK